MIKRKYIAWLTYIFLFTFMFFLNSRIGYITDDWHFKFIFKGFDPADNENRIMGIGDIYKSMSFFYIFSGGRVFAHSVLQTILMVDKLVFNLLNSAIFCLLIWLVSYLSHTRETVIKWYNQIIIIFLMFIFIPSFGDTCLWMSGAINYLWMSIFPLMFIWCYRKSKNGLCLITGFISSFTNEATGGMIIVYILANKFVKKEKISKINILEILLPMVGEAFILLAPGNYNRATQIDQTSVFSVSVALRKFGKAMLWLVEDNYVFLIIPIIVILLVYRKNIKEFAEEIALLLSSFAGIGALALSGTFIKRAHFLCIIFIICAFISALCKIMNKESVLYLFAENRKVKKLSMFRKGCVSIPYVFLILGVIYLAYNTYLFTDATQKDMEQIKMIETASKAGQDISIVPIIHYNGGKIYPIEGSCSKDYEARWKSQYYGIEIKNLS